VVTAQRTVEKLVDVPIAVSAFDNAALERRQIEQATDLQLNIPNVSFIKTNFTGSNFQIRGISLSSVGPSSDSGVETHSTWMMKRTTTLLPPSSTSPHLQCVG
jgi:outer membrane receptor protein involved in Fe transport